MNYICSFVLAIGDNDSSKTVALAKDLNDKGFKIRLDQDIECMGHVFEDESIAIILNDLPEIQRLLQHLKTLNVW